MSPVFTFVLGLLIGWLIEWLIDFFYWRRRYRADTPGYVPATGRRSQSMGEPVMERAAPPVPDDLKIIKGIGPVIERKLNDAGVSTFEQLGSLTAGDLRRILGKMVERLADEESLLQQARDLARRK
jgi:predicted flap endonuclease-1-like 5' DNA nuclease